MQLLDVIIEQIVALYPHSGPLESPEVPPISNAFREYLTKTSNGNMAQLVEFNAFVELFFKLKA